MKTRIVAGCFVCVLVVVGLAIAQGSKPIDDGGEHDFGGKILVVRTSSQTEVNTGGGIIEKAKMRRLGDHLFLVGQFPKMGEEFKASTGTVIWIPVADMVCICEFENMEAVRKSLAEIKEAKDD